MSTQAFGARLRHERERRGIALSSVADRTKIAPPLLTALERGDLARLPGGLYRRSFLRAYAEAVGLDPTEVIAELLECFPDPVEPASDSGPAGASPRVPATGSSSMLRLRIDPSPQVCRGGSILADARHRLAAIAADFVILGVISIGFWVGLEDVWMPLAIAMAGYYGGGILILGNTPGVCVSAALATDHPARSAASPVPHA